MNPVGAIVAEVEADSPAAKAGIEAGDVITSVNDETVRGSRDLVRTIAAIAPGASTKLGIIHDAQAMAVTLILGELPRVPTEANVDEPEAAAEKPILGLTVAPASSVAGLGDRGVVIVEIDPAGLAAKSDLQTGDVILDVGHHPVKTPEEVRTIVDQARSQTKHLILLRVKRGDTIAFTAVSIS